MKLSVPAFLAGLLPMSAVVATLLFNQASRRIEQGHQEWALRPVVVAAEDIPAGKPITYGIIAQRSIPAWFVTGSMVPPADAAAVINRPANVTLHAGDALRWTMFADHSAPDACFRAIVAKVNAAGEAARDGAISRFESRMGAPLPEPEPPRLPKSDSSGEVPVIVLTAEVREGTVLEESMLAVGKLPRLLVTASFIPADRLRDAVGARTLVPLQPRDALMWQMLDDAERPRRAASCVAEATAALDEARHRVTSEETAAFVRGQEAH
ncbi:MAG: hypothetical protein JXB05_24785 [Myxococcaceae bacterium]|nr:hypothetical protein [Myxococcaceae bacterium]